MFRKLTTTGVARGQLAGSPKTPLRCFRFLCLVSSTTFAHLSRSPFTTTLSLWHLVLAFMSYLESPSSRRRTNPTYHIHTRLHTYKNTPKLGLLSSLPRVAPCPTCLAVNDTHHTTVLSFVLHHREPWRRKRGVGSKEKLSSVKPHTQSAMW